MTDLVRNIELFDRHGGMVALSPKVVCPVVGRKTGDRMLRVSARDLPDSLAVGDVREVAAEDIEGDRLSATVSRVERFGFGPANTDHGDRWQTVCFILDDITIRGEREEGQREAVSIADMDRYAGAGAP